MQKTGMEWRPNEVLLYFISLFFLHCSIAVRSKVRGMCTVDVTRPPPPSSALTSSPKPAFTCKRQQQALEWTGFIVRTGKCKRMFVISKRHDQNNSAPAISVHFNDFPTTIGWMSKFVGW